MKYCLRNQAVHLGEIAAVRICETGHLEDTSSERQMLELRKWLKNLSPRLLVRFIRKVSEETSEFRTSSRPSLTSLIPTKRHELILSIEYRGEPKIMNDLRQVVGLKAVSFAVQAATISSHLAELKNVGLNWKPLSDKDAEELFISHSARNFRIGLSYLDFGSNLTGVLRLTRQTPESIQVTTLSECLKDLDSEVRLVASLRRVDEVRRELTLRTRLRQDESSEDRISRAKATATAEALENTFLSGQDLFEFEFLVVLEGMDEAELKARLKKVQDRLSRLGDIAIETFGCFPSTIAASVGANQHVPLLELDEAILAYLPIATHGDPVPLKHPQIRSLVLHREDRGLSEIDLLSKNHINANSLIIGASGRGKSVLTGLLTTSLLNDPNVKLIKVDVGGSHSRECELFNGVEYQLSLDQPSGINPFQYLTLKENPESIRAVLNKFLEVLVLDEHESTLPKTVRIELDDLLQSYIDSEPANPTLKDFGEFASSFSRRVLLSRWYGRGLYGAAFAESVCKTNTKSSNLSYYNFSQIFQASDKDFAQAGMASVLAQFNLELLTSPEKRVVLICDETPFFIDKCFEFFKFSMANVRKFGASITLIVQLSQHLIKNGDTGLFENAHQRFLFTVDGDPEEFAKRLNLTPEQVDLIRNLEASPGKKSEVLYQYGTEARKLVLKLTPEEYWRLTSNQSDRIKIEKLRTYIPELTLKEAIKCLAHIG